ncbi:CRISPR-associated helicase Cas3' [Jatrophihabitans lederbergiae]|uniref:CRISPR-associated helicase Cas3 n=1 Tax=Jatrophihabitans lederbergiae TaxID=3075547 RepID=A0ABU2J504_9ACTN|nr:CRISPR-associated helicase Cas3' [Jatrophihabitans sp. DSM 44399]MDT0260065.1 CRISPR-associated helicase Cas3' [Jatrophihabitans sp. DSM 44399]
MSSELSAAALSVWAKTNRETGEWMPLWQHLDDSAAVAARIWDDWLSANVKTLISTELPGGLDDGRALLVWLAGIHDIGKVSPAFAIQLEHRGSSRIQHALVRGMADEGFDFGDLSYVWGKRSTYRHELASYRSLSDWLGAYGWSRRAVLPAALVVGGHHGRPPTSQQAKASAGEPELLGEGLWSDVRIEYLERSLRVCDVAGRIESWGNVRLPAVAQTLLTAGVIMSDWVASGFDQFAYGDCFVEADRVERAMDALRLPEPWRAEKADVLDGFADRFTVPAGAQPRPIQREVVEIARSVPEPGMIIVEAPMGEGKTEAALLAAETLAARTGAAGLYIALPTRATASAIFARTMTWLDAITGTGHGTPASVMLVHGKAALDDRFAGIPRSGQTEETDRTTDTPADTRLAVHRWMTGRKKAMLANFAVGTVDQLLFAALKSKHLVLRHLGLASKVVILDEAHAYDVYMSVYLDRALEWLGAYRVPVVVLSATLPSTRRQQMIAAYERGRADRPGVRSMLAGRDYPQLAGDIGYPVVVASTGGSAIVRAVPASERASRITVERFTEDEETTLLAERLNAELAEGGAAVVIRNTVARVQKTAENLRRLMPDTEVIVAHSRFVDAHRARLDDKLLKLFGPTDIEKDTGTAVRIGARHVVVGSQVIEQSLDVDFDVMVTDLAPVDLMLQRMGRLHRHRRGENQSERAPRLRTPVCLVTDIDNWQSEPPKIGRSARYIYSPYVLYRTLAALTPYLDGQALCLPGDIAPLVQSVYGNTDICPSSWTATLDKARVTHDSQQAHKRQQAEKMRLGSPDSTDLLDWLDVAGDSADEDSAAGRGQVRDTDETIEVIVVQRDADGTLRTLPGIGEFSGRRIPITEPIGRRFAQAIASCSLSLPRSLSHPGVADMVIGVLERDRIDSFQAEGQYLLQGELVLVLGPELSAQVLGQLVTYDLDAGLAVAKTAQTATPPPHMHSDANMRGPS